MKRTVSLLMFIIFAAVMTAAAVLAPQLPIDNYWVLIGVGGGIYLVCLVISLMMPDKVMLACVVSAAAAVGFGLIAGGMFVAVGEPDIKMLIAIVGIYSAAFLLHCIITNIGYLKEHPLFGIIAYSLLAIGGAVTYALVTKSAEGWYALMLILPFVVSLILLAADAAGVQDHILKFPLMIAFLLISVFVLVLRFILPVGNGEFFENFSFDAEDDPYNYYKGDD